MRMRQHLPSRGARGNVCEVKPSEMAGNASEINKRGANYQQIFSFQQPEAFVNYAYFTVRFSVGYHAGLPCLAMSRAGDKMLS